MLEELAYLQKTIQALKEVFYSASDAITDAAEQLREAYLAAAPAAMARVDMESILALFGEMEDAGEPRGSGGGIPCPRPSRRLWATERPPVAIYRAQYIKRINPHARSTIKQYRNRRKP